MPIISNQIQNNQRSNTTVTPQSRTYRSGGTTVRLHEGQTLKGVVTDVHGKEITLSMNDGSSFTGNLPDASQYSIGQKAAFQITGLAENTIYLKAMTGAYLLDMEDTIEQALEEASLPKTDRNIDVVRSLLKNQQSISRDNILSSIRLCAQFPDADVDSVITMNRLSLPLTKESVAQFENYENQNHQLLYKMESLTDSVNEMMESIVSHVPRLTKEIASRIFSIALDGEPSAEEQALTAKQPETETANSVPASEAASSEADESTTAGSTGETEAAVLEQDATGNTTADEKISSGTENEKAAGTNTAGEDVAAENNTVKDSDETGTAETVSRENSSGEKVSGQNTLNPKEMTAEANAGDESLSAEEQSSAEKTVSGPFSRMRQLFSNLTENTLALKSAAADSELSEDFRTPFIHEQTGFILSQSEREEFSQSLSEYPLPDSVKEGIADGTITAREFLTQVQNAFPQMTEEQAGTLLTSKSFQSILKAQFRSNWTISPEQMKEPDAMNDLYNKMSRQLSDLENFSQNTFGKDIFSELSESARDMQDNMDFMKTMNQTFQYMQLPLKLENQNAHGDLYVMTRKESLKKDPNHLKVLLHLEMDALGTLDIHIARENTSVSAHFYVTKKSTKDLLETNMELLSNAINEQGYAFTSELSMKEKELDIVNDFIGADAPVGDFKRYNFDLRA
jgi:hypothetical protein